MLFSNSLEISVREIRRGAGGGSKEFSKVEHSPTNDIPFSSISRFADSFDDEDAVTTNDGGEEKEVEEEDDEEEETFEEGGGKEEEASAAVTAAVGIFLIRAPLLLFLALDFFVLAIATSRFLRSY